MGREETSVPAPSDLASSVAGFWRAVEPLRGELRPEYFRHLVLGLLFLQSLSSEEQLEEPRVPPGARWRRLVDQAHGARGGEAMDRAFQSLSRANPRLAGMPSAEYAGEALDPAQLRRLVDYLDGLQPEHETLSVASRYLAQVYASWLVRFADAGEDVYVRSTLSLSAAYRDGFCVKSLPPALGAQYDIHPLGPLYYAHANVKPFFLTPQTAFHQREARVGFDGTNYLVIWCESHYTQGDWLMGCRVSPTGNVLDPGGFPIHKGGEHRKPRLAMGNDVKTGQTVSLVVWTAWMPDAKVRGALVRTAGAPEVVGHIRTDALNEVVTGAQAVQSQGIPIFPDIDDHFSPFMEYLADWSYSYPDVTFDGTDFVVTAVSGYDVLARLVSSEGDGVKVKQPPEASVVYPRGEPITVKVWNGKGVALPGYCPTWTRIVSGGGPHCLVTWHMLVAPGVGNLYGEELIFNGSSWQTGQPKVISKDLEPGYGYCAMASDGQGSHLQTWHDLRRAAQKKTEPWQIAWPDLAVGPITPVAGQPTDFNVGCSPLIFEANHGDYYPEVAYDGKNYLVTWGSFTSDLVNFNPALGCLTAIKMAAYVTPAAKVLTSFYIKAEDGCGAQLGDVCFGSTEGLVVYEHRDPSKWNPPASDRKLRLRLVAKTP